MTPKITVPSDFSVSYFFNGTKTIPIEKFDVEPSFCPFEYVLRKTECEIVTFEKQTLTIASTEQQTVNHTLYLEV